VVRGDALRDHRRVLIDSSVWIYHFEQHPEFAVAAGRVVQSLEEGHFRGVVSELTLLELTVRPLQLGRQDIADEYELLLSYFPNVQLEPVSREVLLDAASLRARYRLRTPEAILLATGIRSAATAAVTNDVGWKVVRGSGIDTVLLTELSG
jgi:predicted nucleic acid-binding protein